MSQRIHLGAIVLRDGRLMLVRPAVDGPWELPGGPLLPTHADTESAMDEILAAFGIASPAIEEDFLDTLHLREEDGALVYNLYAPTEWTGEPRVSPGAGLGWFTPEELASVAMDARIRDALLAAFGMVEPPPGEDRLLEEMARAMGLAGGQAVPLSPRAAVGRPGAGPAAALEDRWANTDLPQATRGLIAVALAAAAGRPGPLSEAIDDAARHGASVAHLAETLRMVGAYAGYPVAADAWAVLEEKLAGFEAEGRGS